MTEALRNGAQFEDVVYWGTFLEVMSCSGSSLSLTFLAIMRWGVSSHQTLIPQQKQGTSKHASDKPASWTCSLQVFDHRADSLTQTHKQIRLHGNPPVQVGSGRVVWVLGGLNDWDLESDNPGLKSQLLHWTDSMWLWASLPTILNLCSWFQTRLAAPERTACLRHQLPGFEAQIFCELTLWCWECCWPWVPSS